MKITVESTSRVVEVRTQWPEELNRAVNTISLAVPTEVTSALRIAIERALHVPARVWEGTTDSGIQVIALVTRIAHHKRDDAFAQQFEQELQAQRTPSSDALQAFPARLIL